MDFQYISIDFQYISMDFQWISNCAGNFDWLLSPAGTQSDWKNWHAGSNTLWQQTPSGPGRTLWSWTHPSGRGRTLWSWTRSGPAQSSSSSGVFSGRLAPSALRYALRQVLQKGHAGIWAVGSLELGQKPEMWILSVVGHFWTLCLKRAWRASWRCSRALVLRILFGPAGAFASGTGNGGGGAGGSAAGSAAGTFWTLTTTGGGGGGGGWRLGQTPMTGALGALCTTGKAWSRLGRLVPNWRRILFVFWFAS